MADNLDNAFTIFGLEPQFNIDIADLERRYLELQVNHHPDRFVVQSIDKRQAATEQASVINNAYRQLRSPFERAKLLIILEYATKTKSSSSIHFDPLASNLPLPPDFLLEQMEQRELLEDAKLIRDSDALQRLRQIWQQQADILWQSIEDALDEKHDVESASLYLRQLKFVMTQLDVLDETLFEWSL
ncbi:MAG: Fe-S protein assembly co-chaperone HscB [Pseudomonadota bacterium]